MNKGTTTEFVEFLDYIGHKAFCVSELSSMAVSANHLLGAYFFLLVARDTLSTTPHNNGVDDIIDDTRKVLKRLIDRMEKVSLQLSYGYKGRGNAQKTSQTN